MISRIALAAATLLALADAGCCDRGPAYPRSPEWHGDRFEDRTLSPPRVTPWSFAFRRLVPSHRNRDRTFRPPVVVNDGSLLREGSLDPSVTWIGHATTLLQLGHWNVLTDPIFSSRLPFIPRHAPPGVALEDLPHVHVVLVSHDHIDHLDEPSIERLDRQPARQPLYVVPLGIGPWLRAHGATRVVELDWWQSTVVTDPSGLRAPMRITLVPAIHWSQRCLNDRNRRLWGGFVVEAGDLVVYFAGDTGYGPHFHEIRDRFPRIDLALLPIGAYEPRDVLEPRHESPEDAARAFRDLGARWLVPIHWGTFRLSEEPMGQPPLLLLRALGREATRAYVLPIGGVLRLPRPTPRS